MLTEWTQPLWIVLFYVIHGCFAFILFYLVKKRTEEEQRGVVSWILITSLFLPIIGELFGLLVWYAANKWGTNDMMEDYDEYVTYKPMMLEQLRYEAEASHEILPFSEAFTDQGNRHRKDMIMRLINSNITDKGRYLELGLANSDSETVHYAATTMNLLTDKHEKEVRLSKGNHEPANPITLEPLLFAYERYLKSGLLQGASLSRLQKEYRMLMEAEIDAGLDHPWLLQRLGETYLFQGHPEEGIATLEALIERYPTQSEGYLCLLRYYYQEKDWPRIRTVLSSMRERVPEANIPRNQRFVVDHMWGGGEQ